MRLQHSLAIGLLLSTLLVACGGPAQNEEVARIAPLVEAVEARFGSLPVEQTLPGVVRARNQVWIRPEIGGRVTEVLVRSGQAVKRGQELVRLDGEELLERQRQAEADVRLAEAAARAAQARVGELESRVRRNRTLAQQQLVSEQELETLEAQLETMRASAEEEVARVEQARSTVEERRAALSKTAVRAPVAGHLGERRVEVGMRVDPSTVLFPLGDLDELIVEVDIPETMLSSLSEDLPAIVETRGAATRQTIEARLSRISPFLARESFTTAGEIDLLNPEGKLKPGMFVTVRILIGESRQATLVPTSAVWEDPESGERGVFLIEETEGLASPSSGTGETSERERAVTFRPVQVLAEGRGSAGVTDVEEGAWVVTVGQHLLGSELRNAVADGGPGQEGVAARVRPVAWDKVLALEALQDEDLLAGFLDKQRKVAEALGAEIPASEDEVDRVMQAARAAEQGPGDS